MTRLGLISDVHGDPVGLELAWSHLMVMGADLIVCAGDLVGYGPFPDRVLAFVTDRRIPSIRGNHDRWALERGPGEPDEFGGGTPAPETLEDLRALEPSLVLEREGKVVVVVHGSPRGDMEFITPRSHPPRILDALLATLGADVLVHGHTHRPMWYRSASGGLVVNPGSIVSVPVVESSRSFAMLDLKAMAVTFHDVESGRLLEVSPWPGSE
ncbi:YfcE family phosphodiesterase [Tautonia sociabilis]|uniref:Phosphoesterase n=2 Tax=Tautonia sociabilis TaxID=2080755 RepID=A0A432MFD1_9BACT|nr:YfcE family phosphodiesterase [Tautonia sociabilis]